MESKALNPWLKRHPFLCAIGGKNWDPELINILAGSKSNDFLSRRCTDFESYEIWLKMTTQRGTQGVVRLEINSATSIAKAIKESGVTMGEIKFIYVKKVFSSHTTFEIYEPLRGCTFEQMINDILEEKN
jgi:hypothetical protein